MSLRLRKEKLLFPPLSVATPTTGLDEAFLSKIDGIEDTLQIIKERTIPDILDLPPAYFQNIPSNLISAIKGRIKLHTSKNATDAQVLFVLDGVKHLFQPAFAEEIQLVIDRMRGIMQASSSIPDAR